MGDGLALTSREGFDLVTADGVGVEGSSPCAEECCGPIALCELVYKVVPCNPYVEGGSGSASPCPEHEPLWMCEDAVFEDGVRVNTTHGRVITYSGLCYKNPGVDGQAERSLRADLPPGTNVLETGDFGWTDDCDTPECGSVRTFVRATPCSGQDLFNATVTEVYVCAGMVALRGCGWIRRGESDSEPWICWMVQAGGVMVDEDDIPVDSRVVKVFDDYDPDPRGCCFCVAGCLPTSAPKAACVDGELQQDELIECCCDSDNFRIRVESLSASYRFYDDPLRAEHWAMLQAGIHRVLGGVQQPESQPTVVRITGTGLDPQEISLGFPPFFCAAFSSIFSHLPSVFPGAGAPLCSEDRRDADGIGDVFTVDYVHSCNAQTVSIRQEQWGPYGGNPTPRLRTVWTASVTLVREDLGIGRCTGECAGSGSGIGAAQRLLRASGRAVSLRGSGKPAAGRGCGGCREEGGF